MINASEAIEGRQYKTASGILVEVIEKRLDTILVKSGETGHNVPIPLTYKLEPVINTTVVLAKEQPVQGHTELAVVEVKKEAAMSEETVAPVEKVRKVKKSNIVDEGLKANLSVADITKNVLTAFPETLEKSVRNLISVRRSKLKQSAPAA